MAITYNVTIDQAEIELAVANHVKNVLGLNGDVVIKLTNGSGREATNLMAAVDVNPSAKIEPQEKQLDLPVSEPQTVVAQPDVTPMPELEQSGVVEQIMEQEEVTVGAALNFGS